MAPFACDVIRKRNVDDLEKSETKTGYSTEDYGKIHAGNTVAWEHPKRGNSGVEWSKGSDHIVPKTVVLANWTTGRFVQLSSGI